MQVNIPWIAPMVKSKKQTKQKRSSIDCSSFCLPFSEIYNIMKKYQFFLSKNLPFSDIRVKR